ncbi:molybdopterin molybdotransferase MoeA [Radicibacter daui]|uniref:molybdopterin molybdotransferase MoeA n=1 Tax=Radicibacter daui TaxID=3064829 RepID=UPI004046CE5E
MIPVAEARERILSALSPTGPETVDLLSAAGRITAVSVTARRDQPPLAVSAMDGYAARGEDASPVGARLEVIGAVPAGQQFAGTVGPGQCVRIFTGAPLPAGADTVILQENVTAEGSNIRLEHETRPGRHVRQAGLDFTAGDPLIPAGRRLTARDIGLLAAMNVPWVSVHRRPRIAIIATGDEIALPGEPLQPAGITSSNSFALAAAITGWGGLADLHPIVRDEPEALAAAFGAARNADLILTSGGASVGEHDHVREVAGDSGMELDFWRIAMRPGKPLLFGRLARTPLLGLPGNPVSALVCALLFLKPAIARLCGESASGLLPTFPARLAAPLAANDGREDYLRARLEPATGADSLPSVTAGTAQDSSMLSVLAGADCLIRRPPHALAAQAGDIVECLAFDHGF